jgi:Protein of unknown function (DUF3108)
MGPGLSSLSALSTLHVSDAAVAAPTRRERVLLAALLLSLAIHWLGVSGVADWLSEQFRSEEPEIGPPLRAVLRPPPPPTYQTPPRPAPPKPKPRPRPVAPPVMTAPAVEAETVLPLADASGTGTQETAPGVPAESVAPPAEAPVAAPVQEPPPVEEPEPVLAPPSIRVPKRIDLVGTLFVGEQNFMVGTGGFRLRHDGNRYEISVLGQPKGLARLFVNGEFTGVSRGAITPNGLQPSEYVEERGRPDRREAATLDWEAGVIHLKDDKIVPIEPPVYDRLSVIMQFYYRPPEANELSMRVTGTRYVDTYTFRREANEKLELAFGNIDADLWRANFEDGNPRIEIWMSPEYHYLPLRVRIHARKVNGGRFATLTINEIRVED